MRKTSIFCLLIMICACQKKPKCDIEETILSDLRNRVNQTIYFQSTKGDMDTIQIARIDRIDDFVGFPIKVPYCGIELEIVHLPINNWIDSKSVATNPDSTITNNQALISVENGYKWIKYREFKAEYIPKPNNQVDTIIDHNPYSFVENPIIKVIWSKKNGLIEYRKENGETFKIKNAP